MLYANEAQDKNVVLEDAGLTKATGKDKNLQSALVKEETSFIARIAELGES